MRLQLSNQQTTNFRNFRRNQCKHQSDSFQSKYCSISDRCIGVLFLSICTQTTFFYVPEIRFRLWIQLKSFVYFRCSFAAVDGRALPNIRVTQKKKKKTVTEHIRAARFSRRILEKVNYFPGLGLAHGGSAIPPPLKFYIYFFFLYNSFIYVLRVSHHFPF